MRLTYFPPDPQNSHFHLITMISILIYQLPYCSLQSQPWSTDPSGNTPLLPQIHHQWTYTVHMTGEFHKPPCTWAHCLNTHTHLISVQHFPLHRLHLISNHRFLKYTLFPFLGRMPCSSILPMPWSSVHSCQPSLPTDWISSSFLRTRQSKGPQRLSPWCEMALRTESKSSGHQHCLLRIETGERSLGRRNSHKSWSRCSQ